MENKTPNHQFTTVVSAERIAINYAGQRVLTMHVLEPIEVNAQVRKNQQFANRIKNDLREGRCTYAAAQNLYNELTENNL